MSYNVKMDTITVNDVEYDVERSEDRGGWGGTTLTLRTFDVEQDEFVDAFPGLEGTLGYEESGEGYSPREWSNVGTMAVSYRGYSLGDTDISEIDFEVECDNCDDDCIVKISEHETEPCKVCESSGYRTMNPAEYFIKNEGARVVIGLFVYEHSGITMSAGSRVGVQIKQSDVRSTNRFIGDDAGWDTSFVGFIYDTPEGVKQCLGDSSDGITDEQIEAALRSEVSVYASYLEGDLTYYNVQDEETGFMEGCGGYVGSADECQDECFAAMEQAIIKRLAEQQERAEMAARDIITN